MPTNELTLERRQLELVLQRVRAAEISAAVVTTAVVVATYQQVGVPVAFAWFASVFVSFAMRHWLVRGKLGTLHTIDDLSGFARHVAAVHGLIGAAIASAGWWFYGSLGSGSQFALTLVLAGWPATGMSVLGVHRRSYLFYLVCYFSVLVSAWWYFHPDNWLVLVGLAVIPPLLASASKNLSQLINTISILEQEKDKLLEQQQTLISSLESAKTEAEQANLAKSRFLAAASHDLRQPLQAISLLSGVLRSISIEKRVMDISTQLARASESLDTLFGSILDISRLEAGAVKPHTVDFSVDTLFARLQSEYGARAAAKGLTFTASPTAVRLHSDPVLFERIIRNLVENAIRYTREGSVALTLTESTCGIEVAVTDSGIGINQPEQERIFQEYYQATKTPEAQEIGMGLGLAIVRRLCELLTFKISVQSNAGSGSVFCVTIPKELVASAAPSLVAKPPPSQLDLGGHRVLVIDDDPLVREALKAALTAWGATVSSCAALSELEALLIQTPVPSIAIIDYRLAEGPLGLEVAMQIHERLPAIKRIMMTGELLLDPHLEATGMPILRKPVSHDQLARVLRQLIKQHEPS
jgi:two-component system, sensor histidine kinase